MRLGLLWPADGRNDGEFWRWLPPGIELLIARYDVGGNLDLAQLERDAEQSAVAARLLRHVKPAAVGLGDCAGSFIGGPGADLEQAQAVASILGCPAVTMSTALIEACESLALRKISVLSPYNCEVTERLVKFLVSHGLDVCNAHATGLTDEEAIDMERWFELAGRTMQENADGLLVAGGGLSLSGQVSAIESRIGKPLICGPGALMWSLLARTGVAMMLPDRGRLFGNEIFKPPHAVLSRHLSSATKTFAVTSTPPVFTSANGARLTSHDGQILLDFACGSGTTSLGHNHPRITAAVRAVLERGFSHVGPHFHAEPQIRLYQRLAGLLPPGLQRFQPATNGTEATEIALKAAMHFTGARKFLAFGGSYHGRSFGALAVSSPRARGANAKLAPFAPEAVFLPFNAGAKSIAGIMAECSPLAGIIVEPVQATQGMILPRAGFLESLRAAADSAGIPLIFDEVFTGFGRTGSLFYFDQAGVVPDLLVLAKAFGGGFPAALVSGRDEILMHWPPGTQSSTFQLHPVAAAASLAVLDTIREEGLLQAAQRIGAQLGMQAARLRHHHSVQEIRGIGAMYGIEIASENRPLTKAIRAAALEMGLITWECGGNGHVIGLIPPLTVSDEEIAEACAILHCAMERVSG